MEHLFVRHNLSFLDLKAQVFFSSSQKSVLQPQELPLGNNRTLSSARLVTHKWDFLNKETQTQVLKAKATVHPRNKILSSSCLSFLHRKQNKKFARFYRSFFFMLLIWTRTHKCATFQVFYILALSKKQCYYWLLKENKKKIEMLNQRILNKIWNKTKTKKYFY